jgi:hypothetical protein
MYPAQTNPRFVWENTKFTCNLAFRFKCDMINGHTH